MRRRARLPAPRRRAHRRARPRRRHRPPRAAGDRRRRPHRAAAPAAGLRPRPALRARRTPTCCWRRCEPPPRTASSCPSGRPRSTACSSRCSSHGAEWMPRAWVELATRAARRGHDRRAGRHPRAARRGLELPAAERAGRHDDRHHRRVRAADARPLAAAGPRRPGEGRLQLGRRLRRARTSCAATADYERFVRKHLHLFAPAEDGEVEAGPVARAPGARPVRAAAGRALRRRSTASCSRAPPTATPRASAGRSARPTAASSCPPCWCARRGGTAPRAAARRRRAHAAPLPAGPDRHRRSAAAAAFGALGVAAGAPAAARRPRARPGRPRLGRRAGCARAKKRLPLILPLDAAARAVVEAYKRARRADAPRPPAR